MKNEKGKYYRIILSIMGFNPITMEGGISHLYKNLVKGIYQSIPHYYEEPHKVDLEEFKFSMRWALADVFNGGCEIEDEAEDLFDNLNKENENCCDFCLKQSRKNNLSIVTIEKNDFRICNFCLEKRNSELLKEKED